MTTYMHNTTRVDARLKDAQYAAHKAIWRHERLKMMCAGAAAGYIAGVLLWRIVPAEVAAVLLVMCPLLGLGLAAVPMFLNGWWKK